jgi:alpha-tubulin suppressor-like RCC1 family protein
MGVRGAGLRAALVRRNGTRSGVGRIPCFCLWSAEPLKSMLFQFRRFRTAFALTASTVLVASSLGLAPLSVSADPGSIITLDLVEGVAGDEVTATSDVAGFGLGSSDVLFSFEGTLSAVAPITVDPEDVQRGTFDVPDIDPGVYDLEFFTSDAVTAAGVGFGHTCVALAGAVYCWGGDLGGNLGDGADADSDVPVKVLDGDMGNDSVDALALGEGHTCALKAGSVYCWGSQEFGQLGNDVFEAGSELPVLAGSGPDGFTNTGVAAITAGQHHTCALQDGSVYCWGANDLGQLGDGTTDDQGLGVKVADGDMGNSDVIAISSSWNHTCALKQDGSIYCWGANDLGQLGDGTTDGSTSPVMVADGEMVNDGVTAVAAGWNHTCAVKDGEAYCWGSNDLGQLGAGDLGVGGGGPAADPSEPVKALQGAMPATTGVTTISAGQGHTCALNDSMVFCWGADGDEGVLGDGADADSAVPVKVADGDMGNSGVSAVFASSEFHTCAVKDGAVFCWGSNDVGQIGDGAAGTSRSTPVASQLVRYSIGVAEFTIIEEDAAPQPVLNADGELPLLAPGAVEVFVDGELVSVLVEVRNDTELVITGDGFELVLAGGCAEGPCSVETVDGLSSLILETDGALILTGTGYLADSVAHAWLFSDPTYFGPVTVAEDGTFTATFELGDFPSGDHTMQLNGVADTESELTINVGLRIIEVEEVIEEIVEDEPAIEDEGPLSAVTGGGLGLLAVGLILLIAGFGTRRAIRRSSV